MILNNVKSGGIAACDLQIAAPPGGDLQIPVCRSEDRRPKGRDLKISPSRAAKFQRRCRKKIMKFFICRISPSGCANPIRVSLFEFRCVWFPTWRNSNNFFRQRQISPFRPIDILQVSKTCESGCVYTLPSSILLHHFFSSSSHLSEELLKKYWISAGDGPFRLYSRKSFTKDQSGNSDRINR